jgi:hypothetical protein
MKEAITSYETAILTKATRRNFPEDAILQLIKNFIAVYPAACTPHSHCRENVGSSKLEGFVWYFIVKMCTNIVGISKASAPLEL